MFAVKVGDEVGFYRENSSYGSLRGTGFATVTKINGFGHIMLDNGYTFDKHGVERTKSFIVRKLIDAARLREIEAADEARSNRNHSAREAESMIAKVFANRRNGCGDYFITAEDKAEMIALINNIKEYK